MPSSETRGTTLARRLRRDQTDAEKLLWSKLHANQIYGIKFRRQVLLSPYIVDFCCEERKLIIEVDGRQHAQTTESDIERTKFLKRRGYRVIRFWKNEVLTNVAGVLEVIASSTTSPSP